MMGRVVPLMSVLMLLALVVSTTAYRPKFCLKDMDSGPCFGFFIRFFYNRITGRCEEFVYGNCEGNKNNFASFAECQKVCG